MASETETRTVAAASSAVMQPTKRGLDALEEVSASKRRKVPYHRHHSIQQRPQQRPAGSEPAFVEPESVDKLLIDSIKTVLEEEGLKQNVQDPLIESMALEALYGATQEFVLTLCASVRRSMLAARRTVPIAPDFEAAIDILSLPRPDDQLVPYQTKPSINPPLFLYPTPPPEDNEEQAAFYGGSHDLPSDFLGTELDGKTALSRFSHSTASLPPLPSAHTYKSTAVFGQRETDSRRIRELATEEGKLGEQALRKLAGAVKIGAAPPATAAAAAAAAAAEEAALKQNAAKSPSSPSSSLKKKARARRRRPVDDEAAEEDGFERAIDALLRAEPEGFELGPIVTAEKSVRMPDDSQIKRRAKAGNGDGTEQTAATTTATATATTS